MNSSILLIISGSIAAYKSLDLIRRTRERGIDVRCIVTRGGEQFVTPMSVATVSENPVYTELFSLKDEAEMGHIRLSREADLVVVAPASANMIAKMANGYADDLAGATLLASNKPVLVAPAMNTQMWAHPATQRNLAQIQKDGAVIIEPGEGMLACGEVGAGRMAEPEEILKIIVKHLKNSPPLVGGVRGGVLSIDSGPPTQPSTLTRVEPARGEGILVGLKALVTSGPTFEAIDPVRHLGNRSSGKQGHAIAAALARHGAEVTLVSGPTALDVPQGVRLVSVTTAKEMLAACEKALPADIAVCAAAVSDWRAESVAAHKLKKRGNAGPPKLKLAENPDILKALSNHKKRPKLVIGFAAETEAMIKNAADKRKAKGCDWIVANDVSGGKGFDADENEVALITSKGEEKWPRMGKADIAERLALKIVDYLQGKNNRHPREGGDLKSRHS